MDAQSWAAGKKELRKKQSKKLERKSFVDWLGKKHQGKESTSGKLSIITMALRKIIAKAIFFKYLLALQNILKPRFFFNQ